MVRATLFAHAGKIGEEQLELKSGPQPALSARDPSTLRAHVRALERQQIAEALDRCGNNQTETAKVLGIARGTLRSRMLELGIPPRR
jgi:DNA-binding NtrC family response regulator